MGTSASFGTPAGGQWSTVKREISSYLGGGTSTTPSAIAGGAVAAAGGLSFMGGGGNAGALARGQGRIAGVVTGVGGFGAAVRAGGLNGALGRLGLDELRGRSAHDVVGAISEHLCGNAEGLDREYLQAALSEALLEAASVGEELGYNDFAAGLEKFLGTEGPEGLVQLFLENLVFDSIWGKIEQHAVDRSPDAASLESLMAAIRGVCVAQVQDRIAAARGGGTFAGIDWFGRGGRDFGLSIVTEIEQRLSALTEQ
jgi:hypothetical protein